MLSSSSGHMDSECSHRESESARIGPVRPARHTETAAPSRAREVASPVDALNCAIQGCRVPLHDSGVMMDACVPLGLARIEGSLGGIGGACVHGQGCVGSGALAGGVAAAIHLAPAVVHSRVQRWSSVHA